MKNILLLIAVMALFASCKKKNVCEQFKDKRDKSLYSVIQVGTKCWMAQNLNYDAGAGSYCYDSDAANCTNYGKLYSQSTASAACPEGWHLPSKAEWVALANAYGGLDSAGLKLATGGVSGFEAKYGGIREHPSELYKFLGNKANFWSATEGTPGFYWSYEFTSGFGIIASVEQKGENAMSCRCIKDLE